MNNPPAFPTPVIVPEGQFASVSNDGMTLRDYFAAAAMNGQISCCSTQFACEQLTNEIQRRGWDIKEPEKLMALNAYNYADAMLKAREQ